MKDKVYQVLENAYRFCYSPEHTVELVMNIFYKEIAKELENMINENKKRKR